MFTITVPDDVPTIAEAVVLADAAGEPSCITIRAGTYYPRRPGN